MNKLKEKITLNPIMTFIILIAITILMSGLLSLMGVGATYNRIDKAGNYIQTIETVESLFSLSGVKYIFSSTVSNFAAFAPLVMLIIVLFGIGVMERSGFLKTAFSLLTKHLKKNTVTFIIVFLCVLSSIGGDLGYVIFIPLSALLFLYGRRNPLIGIIAAFAGLACGSGLSIFFTSVDSTLMASTLLGASTLDNAYSLGSFAFIFIMIVASIIATLVITRITESLIAPKIGKYEFATEEEEYVISNKEIRGLLFGLGAGFIYLLVILYFVMPIKFLPLAGSLLDNSQSFYIDKLFSYNSAFGNGFVFIVVILFVIWGLFYGLGAKTIRNNNDVCDYLGHSLDGIGKPITLIFFAATFISIFKQTNIGTVIVASFASLISNTAFQGIPLIILLFILGAISAIFVPSSVIRWSILSGVTIPIMMNAGISPEFSQVIFRFSDTLTIGMTPLFAYFVIYLAYIEKYNQEDKAIPLFKAIRYQIPYNLAVGGILLILLIIWFLLGVPIGIGGSAAL